ncbi:MAG: trypsin-like peptidase domain-containing protein [Lachnospiraceae bacterium]|nr:trypsin-like peptidase domain-containing protein [Lachnospiraceae bacterium]
MSENNGYTDYNDYTENSGSLISSNSDSYSSSQSGSSDTAGAGNGNSYSYGSYYNTVSGSTYGSSGDTASGSGGNGGNGGSGGSGAHNFDSGKKPEGKKPKKKGGLIRKAAAIALSAVLFGGVAGSAMVGVQYAAQKAGIVVDSETQGASIKIAETSSGTSSASGSSSSGSTALGDVSDIVDKVLPSVVAITNSQIYENYRNGGWSSWFGYGYGYGSGSGSDSSEQQEIEAGSGSGIIIGQNDTELLIVTNYHVIEDADSLTITFIDDSTAKASVKGTDSDNDLAVVAVTLSDLEADTKNAIAIATMDTSDDCKVGQGVIAIGNALGYGQSITVGYISALNREVQTSEGTTKNLLQTDAAINPGNSGGALVNSRGEIIGINSAKYSDTDVEGMGFAIPISAVYDIIDDLMNQTTKVEVNESQRGYLGIECKTVNSAYAEAYNMPEGVYVYSILEGGAASKSDLQARDIITKLNGTKVTTQDDLTQELKYYSVGDTVTLTVSRANGAEYETMEIEVTLAKQVKQ